MNHSCVGKSLTEIRKMPGVSDLSLKVGGPFAQALKAEAEGDYVKAGEYLNKAVSAEQSEKA